VLKLTTINATTPESTIIRVGYTYMKSFIYKIRKFVWDVKEEVRTWKLFLLGAVPGRIGMALRRIFLVKAFAHCGENPEIDEGFVVFNPQELSVGDNFICNIHCTINAGGVVKIGNDVMIGPDVKIWSVNHRFDNLTIPIREQDYNYAEVNIDNDVWIGANVFVAPGVSIGKRSVIGACTVVTKSVPPFSLVVGNPGEVIKTFEESK
jgi:maltose O-acetyltransferase